MQSIRSLRTLLLEDYLKEKSEIQMKLYPIIFIILKNQK